MSMKRVSLLDYSKCIFCQDDKDQKLITPKTDGLNTIDNARQLRMKIRYDNYQDATDRLIEVYTSSPMLSIVCHNGCRSSYTSSAKLEKLKAADSADKIHSASASSSKSGASKFPYKLLRSKVPQIDWNLCIFCQKDTKEKLHLIQEYPVSQRILDGSKFDYILRTRLACVYDLIAADCKHHSSCHVKFRRKIDKLDKSSFHTSDMVLLWLSQELEHLSSRPDILDMCDVWERYCTLADEADITIPPSFISRRTTFKDELAERIEGVYELMVLHDQARTEPRTLLVPTKFRHIPVSAMIEDNDMEQTIPTFKHQTDDYFLFMVHVALRIPRDILSHPRPEGIEINGDRAIDCNPDSLYNLVLGGQSLLEDEIDVALDDNHDSFRQTRILSIAQDVMYTARGDKYLTPKHIGLGSTVHQATRSKELVNLLHRAGHVMSYRDVIKLDTALAENTLKTMDEHGAVVPPNLVRGRFVHFSTDTVDINEATLDAKDTFHATQIAAWQRGPPNINLLDDITLSNTQTLRIPDAMNDIIPATNRGNIELPFSSDVTTDWFSKSIDECPSAIKAHAKDMTFILTRHDQHPMPSWTSFNQQASTVNPEQTSVGYLPIIQAPAHEIDTLNTVVMRVWHVAQSMGQEHVVLTVDEGLYPKLMELNGQMSNIKMF